ncbi:hypothetical protein [Carnobacterium sp. 17-4]|uniref:hypothetical protein n=1 Tax=Carnobacterium sp. (strain 17-4) TaxID=208596 RepID=UPI0005A298E0|nr:hypothetical protein [Carnobacterium sp. 17-4]
MGEKIDRVNRNFDLNRYAEVQHAKEKNEMTMLAKNYESEETLVHNALNKVTDAKNLLLNELLKSKFNWNHKNQIVRFLCLVATYPLQRRYACEYYFYKNNLSKYQIICNKEKMSVQNNSANKAVCFNLTFF